MPVRHKRLFAVLLMAASAGTGAALATDVVSFPILAGTREFHVTVMSRMKGKDFLPNILATEHKMSNILVATVRKNGLRYEDQSPLKLALIADYSYDRASSSWVAISVRLELHEPVRFLRRLPVGWESGRTAVT